MVTALYCFTSAVAYDSLFSKATSFSYDQSSVFFFNLRGGRLRELPLYVQIFGVFVWSNLCKCDRTIRELKQLRRRQGQRKKTIGFIRKTTTLHVHHVFEYISMTSTAPLPRETSQFEVLWRTWTYDDKLSFLNLNMDKVVKNSTPGKLAYIWWIVQLQIDAIKVWKDANSFFLVTNFTAVVVVVA